MTAQQIVDRLRDAVELNYPSITARAAANDTLGVINFLVPENGEALFAKEHHGILAWCPVTDVTAASKESLVYELAANAVIFNDGGTIWGASLGDHEEVGWTRAEARENLLAALLPGTTPRPATKRMGEADVDAVLIRLDDESKMEEVTQDAIDALFETAVQFFPELTSGDFGIDDTFALNKAVRTAIESWARGNLPWRYFCDNCDWPVKTVARPDDPQKRPGLRECLANGTHRAAADPEETEHTQTRR
jgi:hypothetical protein